MPYVLIERLCQDPLENYFGRQRSMGHRKDNPSLRDFCYNDNTIRTQKIFRPIAGNCINDDEQLNKIDIETVPCHKKKEEERSHKHDFKYVIYTAIFIATTI